jgi:hypothetical protein
MKTNTPALAILAAILPICAHAQLPALPSLGEVKLSLAGDSLAVSGSPVETTNGKSAPACIGWTATAKVSRGVFESDYDVEVNGQKVGEIEESGGSYTLKDSAGKVQARAQVSDGDGKKTATITGCGGISLGTIEELYTDDQSAFNIKTPAGEALMTTGWTSDSDLAASAPAGSMKVVKNGMFDNFTVTIHGASAPVGLFTAVLNNKAAYRRAAERRRERIGDRPGRHDR